MFHSCSVVKKSASHLGRILSGVLLVCGMTGQAQQLPIPQLKNVFPCGTRQGTSVEVEIGGANLDETRKLYFTHPGITAEMVSDPAKPPARFKVNVAGNVPVGDYDIRSIGKLGISNPRVFSVSDLEEVSENEPNNLRTAANKVPFQCVINGRVNPTEDIDWYVFPAKKGQRVIIECRAWRIDSRLDGAMTLSSSDGKELATSQDENVRDQKRDPMIDFDVPEDGDYFLKFSDFMFNGSMDEFLSAEHQHEAVRRFHQSDGSQARHQGCHHFLRA